MLRGIPRGSTSSCSRSTPTRSRFPMPASTCCAMWDPGVQAATGMIYVRNHAESWSRAVRHRHRRSCVMMRASRSMLGALETTSGALAITAARCSTTTWMRMPSSAGPAHRWLALRALRRGEVVAVAEARSDRHAGDRARHLPPAPALARSWWWMLPYVFGHLRPRQFLSPLYGMTQLVVTPFLLIYAVIVGTSIWVGDGAASSPRSGSTRSTTWSSATSGCALPARPPEHVNASTSGCRSSSAPRAIVLNILLLSPTRYWRWRGSSTIAGRRDRCRTPRPIRHDGFRSHGRVRAACSSCAALR